MASSFSSTVPSGLNASAAEIPSGTLLEGITRKFLVVKPFACSAAKMMFLLFGNTNTFLAGILSAALAMSAALGFIVCPPSIIWSTYKSLNRSAMPFPGATATIPCSLRSTCC